MNVVLSGRNRARSLAELEGALRPMRVVEVSALTLRLEACEDNKATRTFVKEATDPWEVDFAFVEPGFSLANVRLLAMDMDSTLIDIECIDEIADFAGKRLEVSQITKAAMEGELSDFTESLRRRVALLAGVDSKILKQVFADRLRLSTGALELVAAARKHNVYTILVSGGFTYFADRLRDELVLDAAYANSLEEERDKLTGRVVGLVIDAAAKANIVREAMQRLNCSPEQAIVIGDGANDISMMREVVHSVSYRAKPATSALARYSVKFGTLLTALDFFS